MFGKLPPNCIIQFPNGKWGFVGSVNIKLGYTLDNLPITTDLQAEEAAKYHGLPFQKRVKTRSWDSKENALQEAKSLGYNVTN